jgi:hypothetical protein
VTYTRAPDVTITGGDYEHTLDIAGVYDDVSLAYNAMRVQQIFVPMLTDRRFEACELSLANYIILRANGDRSMTAIPVFPFRAFRHSLIITRRDSPLVALEQLAGKRIGVEDYSMTAAVWFRGLIEDEYSVDHRSITWVTPRKQRFPFPPDAPIEVVDEGLEDLLCDGAIDGMLGFATRDSALPPHARKLRGHDCKISSGSSSGGKRIRTREGKCLSAQTGGDLRTMGQGTLGEDVSNVWQRSAAVRLDAAQPASRFNVGGLSCAAGFH